MSKYLVKVSGGTQKGVETVVEAKDLGDCLKIISEQYLSDEYIIEVKSIKE